MHKYWPDLTELLESTSPSAIVSADLSVLNLNVLIHNQALRLHVPTLSVTLTI